MTAVLCCRHIFGNLCFTLHFLWGLHSKSHVVSCQYRAFNLKQPPAVGTLSLHWRNFDAALTKCKRMLAVNSEADVKIKLGLITHTHRFL